MVAATSSPTERQVDGTSQQLARDPHNWGSPMCHKHWGCSQLPNCLREQTGQAVCALWEGEGIQGLGTGGVEKSGEELLLLEGCTVLCGSGGQGVCGRGGLANVVCRWCLKGPQLSLMPNLLSDSRLGQSRPPDIWWLGQNIRLFGYSYSKRFFRKLFGKVFENCSRFFRKDYLDILFRKLFGYCDPKTFRERICERGWAPFAPTVMQSGVYGAEGGISEKSQNIGRKSGNMGKNSARGERSAIQGQKEPRFDSELDPDESGAESDDEHHSE